MQTSRFQLGLMATLAIGLGFSLSSSDAVGYPAGAAVSMGSNPVWSTSGTMSVPWGSWAATMNTVSITTETSAHNLVITDVILAPVVDDNGCRETVKVVLTAGGEDIGTFVANTPYVRNAANSSDGQSRAELRISSGLTVPVDGDLQISVGMLRADGGCSGSSRTTDLFYTLSGYYAQP